MAGHVLIYYYIAVPEKLQAGSPVSAAKWQYAQNPQRISSENRKKTADFRLTFPLNLWYNSSCTVRETGYNLAKCRQCSLTQLPSA
ncbi:hypothetical protein RUMCAL_01512 [Ruminococcus callidus ATCC 27760]|uniref:Uncharacterized protein n=1 Tax=Ruminococcus callidus ATCC 27760 TaxID=411473 RepID=U2KVQ5_9FIRM|nr:hypothetical protein RUMCAL_01512 [Ruminococcus callidus ATCC 27760]